MNTRARGNTKIVMEKRWTRVPLSEEGDPRFTRLIDIEEVFEEEEIVVLVNRALRQMKYALEGHRNKYVAKGRAGRKDARSNISRK